MSGLLTIALPKWETDCRAILFDLDGTLVDSSACIRSTWQAWASRHNLDPEAVLKAAHGVPTRDTVKCMLSDADVEREVQIIEDLDCQFVHTTIALTGAAALLEQLVDARWAIVTAASRRLANGRLACTGLPIPDTFICSDDIARGKPHPDGYLKAAEKLDLLPRECVVIEDSPSGIAAGVSAGMNVIAVTSTQPRARLDGAHYICDSLVEILNALQCH
jgi:mannitol-1-/sugar-/sorbitol-6-phosphatase